MSAEEQYKSVTGVSINHKDIKKAMIEFAKYHVEQALKAADNNATIDIIDREEISEGSFRPVYGVDSKSILNSYPLDLIK